MGNWQQWIDDNDHSGHKAKKGNKNVFCRKNKIGNGRFGYHLYDSDSTRCKLCGHINKNIGDNTYE